LSTTYISGNLIKLLRVRDLGVHCDTPKLIKFLGLEFTDAKVLLEGYFHFLAPRQATKAEVADGGRLLERMFAKLVVDLRNSEIVSAEVRHQQDF